MDVMKEALIKAAGTDDVSFNTYDVNGLKYDNFALVMGPWTML